MGLNNRLNTLKGKINELEGMAIETIQNEHRRKRLGQTMHRGPSSCGTTLGSLTHMQLQSQGWGKGREQKTSWSNNDQHFSKFDEKYKPNSKLSVNSKHNKHKENHIK